MFSCILLGLGLDDLLKPELVMPLIETLPIEQCLAPYLPEVYIYFWLMFSGPSFGYKYIFVTLNLGSVVSRGCIGVVAEPPFSSASRFIYSCELVFFFLVLYCYFWPSCLMVSFKSFCCTLYFSSSSFHFFPPFFFQSYRYFGQVR